MAHRNVSTHEVYVIITCIYLQEAMYSKEQAARLRKEFWTTFGQYMKPIPSAEGVPVNWVNYRTDVSDIQFKMTADNKEATVGIYLLHKDAGIRSLVFDQFLEFQNLMSLEFGEDWIWESPDTHPTRIYKALPNHSVLKKDDWPALISFFKPRLISFDAFWENAKVIFQDLGA